MYADLCAPREVGLVMTGLLVPTSLVAWSQGRVLGSANCGMAGSSPVGRVSAFGTTPVPAVMAAR